jgi:hypothetical protein
LRALAASLRRPSPALVFALLALVALAMGLLVTGVVGERIITARQRLIAETARDYFVDFAHQEGPRPLAKALDRHERHHTGAFRYALFDAEGRVLGGARLLAAADLPAPGLSTVDIPRGGRMRPYEVLVQPLATGGLLVIYEDLSDRLAFRHAVLTAGAVGMALALTLLAAAAVWLNARTLRRADGIARAADRIAAGDLTARAPVGPGGDVFDRLAESVNAMLERIEELLTGMRTVTDSLAHDLRSPLTRLKGALGRALQPDLAEEARLELLDQAHAEADDALATFAALLDIARAETGLSREMMGEVDLRVLAEEVADLFAPMFEDEGQAFEVRLPEAPVLVAGHALLLKQAVGNLLHNAARYAGRGARVSLTLEADAGGARLIVADDGPGVPEALHGRVQERFVRLDPSRSTPGAGLGLAIAGAGAKLHGGRLLLQDNQPGLKVVLEVARPG